VTIRGVNAEIASAEVFHPASAHGASLHFARTGAQLSLTVPLHRGCAMVRLRTAVATTNP